MTGFLWYLYIYEVYPRLIFKKDFKFETKIYF